MGIKSNQKQFLKGIDTSKYENYEEMKKLVETGDLDLNLLRETYAKYSSGKKFPLSDDHLLCLVASSDDDYAPEVFAQAMQYMVEGKEPKEALEEAIADAADNDADNEVGEKEGEGEKNTEGEKKKEEAISPEQARTLSALGKAIHMSALQSADKAKNDRDFNAKLHEIMVAPSTVKRGSVVLLHRLLSLYGKMNDEGRVVETDIDGWPPIGSKYAAGDSNKRFDRYEYITDGGDKVKGSWSEDFYNQLPEAKTIHDQLALIEAAIDKDKPTPPQFKDSQWTDSRLKNLKGTVKSRYNTGLSKLRDAIKLRHKMVEVETKCDKVTVGFDYVRNPKTDLPLKADDGSFVLRDTDTIVYTAPRGRPGDVNFYTVREFLRINADIAAKNGGTMGAIKDTIAKAPTTKDKGKKAKEAAELYPEPKTFDQVEMCLLAMANFFDHAKSPKQRAEMRATFAKRLTGEGRRDMILLLGGLTDGLRTLFTPNLEEEYNKYVEEDAKKEEEARKNKAA